ncbi:hypothetical protein VCRA2112E186_230040 [Vibrio crassostreae]|nr:hypothetical protein VCRA2112O187_140055 [Vibrio crassostreae]CAK1924156.1 hypothetical protein VCRA2112E186_230040 [Vibrio crassostreae]CAK1935530.1 hypothetical protein VCRA2119O245_260040 [Vibrio crassostreae]CAK1959635.1 hypothetical protein VCRA2113O231_270056 [Vibrio crassostreae]CAK2122178.1 hypothetical protein VCRA2110O175_420030 [Vibrio crassostreae]
MPQTLLELIDSPSSDMLFELNNLVQNEWQIGLTCLIQSGVSK